MAHGTEPAEVRRASCLVKFWIVPDDNLPIFVRRVELAAIGVLVDLETRSRVYRRGQESYAKGRANGRRLRCG